MSTNTTFNSPPIEPEAHRVADGNGRSFDTTFNGEPARAGTIDPFTEVVDYRVSSPKVLLVTEGQVSLDGVVFMPGDMLTVPVDKPTLLQTGCERFAYISRKADAAVDTDTERRLADLASVGIGDSSWWDLPRAEMFDRLAKTVGNTKLEQLELADGATIHIKRECDNPSGSHYDRAYLATIQHFEEIGFLQLGDELRDITSGSAGISLALMSYLLGYQARISVPSELPANRIYPMLKLGAKVFHTGEGYVPHSSQVQVAEIMEFKTDTEWTESRPSDRSGRSLLYSNGKTRICYLNHSENELSPQSFAGIADEIAATVPSATHLLLAEGNWTTIAGISPRIRTLLPNVTLIGYRGESTDGQTENYGTNVPDVPVRFKDPALVDDEVVITNQQRDAMVSHAPHLGRTSLMGIALAQNILETDSSAVVVAFAYDTADRYQN